MKDRLSFFKKKGFWFFAIIPIILIILSPLISLQFLRYDALESGSEFCFRGFFFPTAGYSVQADFDFADSDFSFTRLCFTPSELLESKQDYGVSVNFLNFYLKNLAISSNPYPRISLFSKQGEYHPNGTVFYKMSSLNTPFTYYLASNEKESECRLSGEHLLCALADLDLNQGQEYDLELWGKYSNKRVKSFHSLTIQTPQAVLVEGSSMGEGDVFFSAVDDFEIYFNKDVVLHMDVFLQDQMEGDIPFVIDLVGKDLKIKVLDGIDVGTSAKFTLKNVYGMDGSFLEDEFVLNFSVLEVRRESTNSSNWWEYPDDIVLTAKDGDDLLVLVSKKYKLPSDYAPNDLVSVRGANIPTSRDILVRSILIEPLKELGEAAKNDGISLEIWSGYRSYNTQISTYQHWLNVNSGNVSAVDQISARAGHSEHQLGTAVDFGTPGVSFTTFNSTPASSWLEGNAYRFGFALSFPKGFEAVTGFAHEGWHYRYIGKENAKRHRDSGLPLVQWLSPK